MIARPPFAGWRSLGLTGANHAGLLAALAFDDATRAMMARELLHEGNFACDDIEEQDQCGDVVRTMNPLDPTATFDDPCLRRALALWSLAQLASEDAAAMAPALLEMVKLPEPEEELQDAAFGLVPHDDDALRLRMMAVADPDRALDQVAALVDDAAVIHAALELHLDTAVIRLAEDAERHRAILLRAITDDALTAETRGALVDVFVEATDAESHDALVAVADTADDCDLAERAAEALADRGDRSRLPSRPRSTDAGAHVRALCMLAHSSLDDRDDRLRAWIGKRGMATIDHHSDDYADEPGVTITTTHLDADEVDVESLVEPFFEHGDHAQWVCDGDECATDLVAYRLARAGKSMVVASVRTDSYSGCGC